MLLLHAISTTPSGPTLDADFRGHPVRWVGTTECGGWVSAWSEKVADLQRQDLLEHHAIVQQACSLGPSLPVRFPTWIDDEPSLLDLISSRKAHVEEALRRVRGRSELAVTVVWNGEKAATANVPQGREHAGPDGGGAASSGRRYLEERRAAVEHDTQRRAEARRLAQQLEEQVQASVDAQHVLCPSDGVALSSALLVPSDDAPRIREALVESFGRWPHLQAVVNGPWPPYTFATLEHQSDPGDGEPRR